MNKLKICAVFALFISSAGYAAESSSTSSSAISAFDVGVLLGYSHFSSNGSSSSKLGVGARGGYHLNPNWEFGFDWTFSSTVPSNAVAGYTSNLSLSLIRADYHFVGVVDGLYVGPKLGLAVTNAGGYNGTSFAVGGEVGYDYTVMSNLTVGPLVDVISVAAPTLNGSKASSGTDVQALAACKYFF